MLLKRFLVQLVIPGVWIFVVFTVVNVDSQCICGVFRHQKSLNDSSFVNILNCNVSDLELKNATSSIVIDRTLCCADVKAVTRLSLSTSERTRVADGCFVQFQKLETLRLLNGDIDSLQREQFAGLTSLKTLVFQPRTIGSVQSSAFADIPNLTYLQLNNVINLSANSLVDYKNVQQLFVLLYRTIKNSIDQRAIGNLPSLLTINLQYDSSTTLDLQIYSASNFTSLTKLTITDCSYSEINTQITNWNVFNKLFVLNLERNQFEYLQMDSFKGLSSVEELSLQFNVIREFSTGVWNNLVNLKKLNLASNNLSSLATNAFSNLINLENLNLENNFIKQLTQNLWPKNVVKLILHSNEITEIENSTFDSLYSLRTIDLKKNNLVTLKTGSFLNLRLDELILSNTKIDHFEANSFINTTITKLDLTINTKLRTLDKNVFGLENVKFYLNISQLMMNDGKIEDIDGRLWKYFHTLEEINLSNNRLESLKKDQFTNLNSLKRLDLSKNNITEIYNCTFCGCLEGLVALNMKGNPMINLQDRGLFDGLQNRDLVISTDNGELTGPMNNCSLICYVATTESPTTMSTTDSPTMMSVTDSPTTMSTTDSPTTMSTTDSPTSISTTDSPTTMLTTDSPTTMSTTDSPTTMSATDSPTTISTTDSPTTMSTTDSPTTMSTTDSPTTMSKTDSPTSMSTTDSPTTMSTTDLPTMKSATDSPATMSTTDSPTTISTTEVNTVSSTSTFTITTEAEFSTENRLTSSPKAGSSITSLKYLTTSSFSVTSLINRSTEYPGIGTQSTNDAQRVLTISLSVSLPCLIIVIVIVIFLVVRSLKKRKLMFPYNDIELVNKF